MTKTISIFGSALPEPGTPDYELAYEVGSRLAEAGFAVTTGGYIGTMEAVSKGAREKGGHVIGVTSAQIEKFRPGGANPWVVEEIRYETLRDRLLHVVDHNAGMIVLPGGIGTLAELAMAWNGLQTGEIEPRPLVIVGDHWQTVLPPLLKSVYIKEPHRALLKLVNTAEEAVEWLVKQVGRSETGVVQPQPIFLKLGGSLITDKRQYETIRETVLQRVATEIKAARDANREMSLVLGHGSGSFGHAHAKKHGTRHGVSTAEEWQGFADVSDSALRLNRAVVQALVRNGVPAISLSPSASAKVENGRIISMSVEPIKDALQAGLVPVLHGDVAFDRARGGTILSTEEVMSYLAPFMRPSRLLLAGETDGVYDQAKEIIPEISRDNFEEIKPALGGSAGDDVTGGMATKVRDMLNLSKGMRGLEVVIFSGLAAGNVTAALHNELRSGTKILG